MVNGLPSMVTACWSAEERTCADRQAQAARQRISEDLIDVECIASRGAIIGFMSLTKFAPVLLVAFPSTAASRGLLPEPHTERTAGGSIFYNKNNSPQPLNAYLIELVDYPGSSNSLWQDRSEEHTSELQSLR